MIGQFISYSCMKGHAENAHAQKLFEDSEIFTCAHPGRMKILIGGVSDLGRYIMNENALNDS